MKTKGFSKIVVRILVCVICMISWGTITVAADTGWTLSEDTEIYWVQTEDSECMYEALTEQIQLFDAELAEKVTDTALPICYGERSKAGANDILLVLDSTLNIPAQGYQITVEDSQVTISASDEDGLFYGGRYLIQQLTIQERVAAITDSPDISERALSLDCGRKYYTPEWIKNLIKEMSWSNMNALVLHFSEEMGLGIESTTYPWLAGRDGTLCVSAEIETDNRYLTQHELREIAEVAKLYHIELIPSFDSPGHMNYLVKKYNEYYGLTGEEGIGNYFHYNGKTAIVQGSRNKNYSRGIDISNETAVAFARSLITEYANLFRELGCTKFDIGGDELLGWGSAVVSTSTASSWQQLDHWKQYAINRSGNSNAVAYDGFMYYMNDLYDLVTSLGYTSVRMWNDDALRSADTGWKQVVTLNKNVEILYWTPSGNSSKNNVWTYLNAGYKVHNYLNTYNYYVLGSDAYPKTNQENLYTCWSPYVFDPNSSVEGGKNVAVGNPNVKGSAFCIWCDNPAVKTEGEVFTDVLPMIRANGAKAWDAKANEKAAYTTFTMNLDKMGNAPLGDLTKASEIRGTVDTSALQAVIEEYETSDASAYTEETFAYYTYAVNSGKVLLESGSYTEEEIAETAELIAVARENLMKQEQVLEEEYILQGAFRTSKVNVGKLASLSISVTKGLKVKQIDIYNDQGRKMTITRSTINTKQTDRDIYMPIFSPDEEERGERTYTAYVILEEGTRPADSLALPLTIR